MLCLSPALIFGRRELGSLATVLEHFRGHLSAFWGMHSLWGNKDGAVRMGLCVVPGFTSDSAIFLVSTSCGELLICSAMCSFLLSTLVCLFFVDSRGLCRRSRFLLPSTACSMARYCVSALVGTSSPRINVHALNHRDHSRVCSR